MDGRDVFFEGDHGRDRIPREHRQVFQGEDVGGFADSYDEAVVLHPQGHDVVLAQHFLFH